MRIAVAPERWLVLLILACALCSTGCSLIGLGIGASSPRWERDVSAEKLESYPRGTPLDVTLQPGAAYGAGRLSGSYDSVSGAGLVVATDPGKLSIPLQDVQRVDARKGSKWATGLGIGVGLDLVAVLFGTVLAYAFVGPR